MRRVKIILLLNLLCLTLACSHSHPMPEIRASSELTDSEVEISYGLGHTHRKVLFVAKEALVKGQNFVDRQILREGSIDPSHYHDFFQKASEFLEKTHRNPASDLSACRNPYTLTVRVGTQSKVLKGCRLTDEGALGRLIRNGEFLLYSAK